MGTSVSPSPFDSRPSTTWPPDGARFEGRKACAKRPEAHGGIDRHIDIPDMYDART